MLEEENKMGSVKDIHITSRKPTERGLGEGNFVFSDGFSVFDWGKMPNRIPNKGAALATMAAWNFEQLGKIGVPSHYLGLVDFDGELVTTDQLEEPRNTMAVSLSRVVEPRFVDGKWDYSYFVDGRGRINNFVIPLEVIYRNGAPQGSSLFRTLDAMEKKGDQQGIKALLGKLGLTSKPKPGDLFPKTGYDFTTKFEPTDRKVDDEEAFRISGLTEEQFLRLKRIRADVVGFGKETARRASMTDFDGKQEYRLFNGRVDLADVALTLDENRFMIDVSGKPVQVSKEFLRQYYKATQKDWYADVERAKEEAQSKGIKDWKSLVRLSPKPLPEKLVSLVGEMYASACNRYTRRKFFKEARDLDKVMQDLAPYMAAT